MATTHKEELGIEDGICVDCEFFYECSVREAAENDRQSHIVECDRFKLDMTVSFLSSYFTTKEQL